MKQNYLPGRLALILAFLFVNILWVTAQDSGSFSRTLKLKAQLLNLIFESKEGARFDLPIQNEKGETIRFQASTYRHLNPGAQTGAIRLDLVSSNRSFKCLLSRKLVNGKLEYQIRLMENKGALNYTLASLSNGDYVLQATELEDILTQ